MNTVNTFTKNILQAAKPILTKYWKPPVEIRAAFDLKVGGFTVLAAIAIAVGIASSFFEAEYAEKLENYKRGQVNSANRSNSDYLAWLVLKDAGKDYAECQRNAIRDTHQTLTQIHVKELYDFYSKAEGVKDLAGKVNLHPDAMAELIDAQCSMFADRLSYFNALTYGEPEAKAYKRYPVGKQLRIRSEEGLAELVKNSASPPSRLDGLLFAAIANLCSLIFLFMAQSAYQTRHNRLSIEAAQSTASL